MTRAVSNDPPMTPDADSALSLLAESALQLARSYRKVASFRSLAESFKETLTLLCAKVETIAPLNVSKAAQTLADELGLGAIPVG